MNKKTIVNGAAALAAFVLLLQFFIATQNQQLAQRALEVQQKINSGQQAQRVLLNISTRVIQLSQNDAPLRELTTKYGIRVGSPAANATPAPAAAPTPIPAPAR